jgi:hypothetical protein
VVELTGLLIKLRAQRNRFGRFTQMNLPFTGGVNVLSRAPFPATLAGPGWDFALIERPGDRVNAEPLLSVDLIQHQGFAFLGYKIKRGRQLRLPPGQDSRGAQSGALYAYPRAKSIQCFIYGPGASLLSDAYHPRPRS